MANRAAGKGYENEEYYKNASYVSFSIHNIHVMKESLQKMMEGMERGGVEREGMERGGVERGGVERGGVERGGVERGGVERGGVERGGVERGGVKKGSVVVQAWVMFAEGGMWCDILIDPVGLNQTTHTSYFGSLQWSTPLI